MKSRDGDRHRLGSRDDDSHEEHRAMTDKARIRIAAAVTALFLAGISAAGLAARDHPPQAAATGTLPSVATPSATAAADGSALGEFRGDDERYDAERSVEVESDE